MMRRCFLLSIIMSNLVMINAYAEAIEIPSTPDNSNTAPILAENDVAGTPAAILAQQQAAAARATQSSPATAGTASAEKPHHGSVNANLSLKQQGQRLYAYVVIEQSQARSGKIRIDWTPPLHSSCDKSSYILSYEGKKFHTQAYRTLGYGLINGKSISCTGTWQADVKNAHGIKLTTATINIESVDAYANAKMRSLAAIA